MGSTVGSVQIDKVLVDVPEVDEADHCPDMLVKYKVPFDMRVMITFFSYSGHVRTQAASMSCLSPSVENPEDAFTVYA